MSTRPIMIMAGGTGGHVYPALAVAQDLIARGQSVYWLGTRRGLEATVVPANSIEIEWIDVRGLRGNGLLGWLAAPFRLSRSIAQSLKVIRKRNPKAVLGLGGFVSGPGGAAAYLSRRPLIIHEQNAVAGLTNRLLARFARVVLEAFPGSFNGPADLRCVGNPVRPTIAAIGEQHNTKLERQGPLRLLVLGGSLGARSLNESLAPALARFAENERPEVWHQCGKGQKEVTDTAYASAAVTARIDSFVDDMAAAYQWADLVICRAGALTVAEISAAALPAIFVPYPHAVDDHQTANARSHVESGAALLVADNDLGPDVLHASLQELGRNRVDLHRRAERAAALARPEALQSIVDTCLEVSGGAR